ncbi:MAG: hypothetical protein RL454_1185, partial [Actinomycetota bacterium]
WKTHYNIFHIELSMMHLQHTLVEIRERTGAKFRVAPELKH